MNALWFNVFQLAHLQHYRKNPWFLWKCLMAMPTLAYRTGITLRQWAYQIRIKKATYLRVPVVSVGNLTTGGTGKTPMVIALTQYFEQELNLKVGVLNRGYGAKQAQTYARATNPDYGDEAYEIQQACPNAIVIVGRNRCDNAQKMLQDYTLDIIVLDDGLQYLPLARDFNIALIDDASRLGNGYLLPTGPLREPLSGLRRCDMVLITRPQDDIASLRYANQLLLQHKANRATPGLVRPTLLAIQPLEAYLGNEPVPSAYDDTLPPLANTQASICIAFTGIGQPDQFLNFLNQHHISPSLFNILPDHAPLEGQKLEALREEWETLGKPFIYCTCKDAVKLNLSELGEAMASHIRVVRMGFELPEALKAALHRFSRKQTSTTTSGNRPIPTGIRGIPTSSSLPATRLQSQETYAF
jgi:tetraacyldisaccharide 4'-kinase